MNYFTSALKKYADFSGRSTRSEFWYFILINFIFSVAVSFFDSIIGTSHILSEYGLLQIIYFLIIFIPSIAISVRRLHDTGKNGWMLLIYLIPLVGLVWMIILMVEDSNPVDNKYGPNLKILLNPNSIQPTPVFTESTDNIPIKNIQNKSKNIKLIIFVCIIIFLIIFLLSKIPFCHENKITDYIDNTYGAVIHNNMNKDFTKEDFYPIEVKESYRRAAGICKIPDGGIPENVNFTISIFEDQEKTKLLAYFDKKILGSRSINSGTTGISFYPYNSNEYEITILNNNDMDYQHSFSDPIYLRVNKVDKSVILIKSTESKDVAAFKESMDEFIAQNKNIKPKKLIEDIITAKLGQKIKDGENTEFTVSNVVLDNRCVIIDETCHSVNDFNLNLVLSWVYNNEKHTLDNIIKLGENSLGTLTLIKVMPERETGKVIKDSDYVFTFSVKHY